MHRPLRTLVLSLATSLAAYVLPSQAALLPMDNHSLSEVSGQAGISIRADVLATIKQVRWTDDGGHASLRNVKIDNGCTTPASCPNGAGGSFAFGAAQLGLTLPIFGVNLPTLKIDIVSNASGKQQLQLTLPDLTTINDQLVASGIPAQRIRVRVAADMYVGESRLGSIEMRDITDLRGTFKVWGH
ncbi:DUF6160 family protein [Pseudomonas leptonychotis]|uniref:DUF6160 domain-containing protein n=1 Tax=Pseudomonas leptonychotis TaxID=2448482 RepID=A0A4T2A151_9PSED|nr:DUF6160 family protein [Pseudomonas leptonychotis]TIH10730.1 hypothetical protein D8779_08655 [Pseudomonas leptonychotis]